MQIVGPSGGVVEECGTTPSEFGVLQLESGNFTVVFRTSEDSVVGNGFQMYVICYKPAETSLKGIAIKLQSHFGPGAYIFFRS